MKILQYFMFSLCCTINIYGSALFPHLRTLRPAVQGVTAHPLLNTSGSGYKTPFFNVSGNKSPNLFSSQRPLPIAPFHAQKVDNSESNPNELNSEDTLFYNPLTKSSSTIPDWREKYRITYYPYQRELEAHAKFLKQAIINNPYTCSIYGATGAGIGLGSGLFSNYLNTKTHNFFHNIPNFEVQYSKFSQYLKFLTKPSVRRAIPIKAAGKFCIVFIGLAALSQLQDQENFSLTLPPTLQHIKESIKEKSSNTLRGILSIGDYLNYAP